MKPNFYIPLLAFGMALLIMLSSCGSDTKVNFLLNEQDFPRILTDSMPNDSDNVAVYQIYQGDTVVFKDVTEPLNAVDSRFWNLDGEEGWESRDEEFTEYVYHDLGLVTVVLCVNDTTNCVAKAIFVREAPPDFTPPVREEVVVEPVRPITPKTPPPLKPPVLKFIRPNVYSTNTPDLEFPIRVSIRNVSSKSDVSIEVNGERFTNFSLSKGQLSGKVPLEKGRNTVKVTAGNSAGSASEEIEFICSPNAILVPTVAFAQPSSSNETSTTDKYEIMLVTTNVTKKDQITLTVGGQTVKDFSFSPGSGELTAKISLSSGSNNVKATVNVGGRKASQEVNITYAKPSQKPAPLNKWSMVGVPVSDYPTSTDCIDRVKGSVSFSLSPINEVELQSFKVYTDVCGGVKVELSGPGIKSQFQTALNSGRTQISLADIDAHLDAGNKYTLTLTPIAGYGTCSSSQTPAFNDVESCSGANSANAPALKLDQKGKLVIFDLKFNY